MLQDFFHQLISELEADSNFSEDAAKGIYTLRLDEHLLIAAKELKPGFFLEGKIAEAPKEKKEEIFMKLMDANFLRKGTGEAILGLSKDEKFLTLSLKFPYEMNYAHFKEQVEDFANLLDFWQKELKKWDELTNNALI